MKKTLLSLTLLALATFANAQGTVQFSNNAGTRFTIDGVRPLSTSAGGPAAGTYSFGVFFGPSADAISDTPAGVLGANTTTGGLISAPNANNFQVPGAAENSTVFMQVRGWSSTFETWQAAKAAGTYGETAVRQITLGPASGPGTVIWGADTAKQFQSMNLTVVPEPSTIALGVLGLGSLLLFRRRK
jgi:PEP-CTERM motif